MYYGYTCCASPLTMAVSLPGASFLFYPAPDFQGAQPTHGGYTATATDAGHKRPQQADAGTLTLYGAFPTPTFLAPSVRPACRVDNDLVVDAIVNEALGNVRRTYSTMAVTYYGCTNMAMPTVTLLACHGSTCDDATYYSGTYLLRQATCAFPSHQLGQVAVHFSLNREQATK